jgi:hypothetical protein
MFAQLLKEIFLRPWIIWRLQGSSCRRDSSQRSPSGSYLSIVIMRPTLPLKTYVLKLTLAVFAIGLMYITLALAI